MPSNYQQQSRPNKLFTAIDDHHRDEFDEAEQPEDNRRTSSLKDTSRRRSYQDESDTETEQLERDRREEHSKRFVNESRRRRGLYRDGNGNLRWGPVRPDHSNSSSTKHTRGYTLYKNKEYAEAEQTLRQAVEHREKVLGENHKDTLRSKQLLARTLYGLKRYEESEQLLREVLRLRKRVFGVDNAHTLKSNFLLTQALYQQEKYSEAKTLLQKLLKQEQSKYGMDHHNTKHVESLLRRTITAMEPIIPAYVFGSEKPIHDAVPAIEPIILKKASASKRVSFEVVPAKEPAMTTEALTSIRAFPHVIVTKEPAVSADTIESKEVFQEAIPTKTQVASRSSHEDTVQSRLSDFFVDKNQRQEAYTDSEIQRISTLLSQLNLQWSKVPRTYIVLRTIGCLELLDTFIDLGYCDHWFPITERNLPPSLRPSKRSQFVAAQNLIMTKAINLEKGQHCFFQKDERLPLEMKDILGSGAYGQVNRVLSSISFQEYALKRVPRSTVFGGRGTEFVKQFIAEIQVLKRIKHDHVVEFVGSYTDPKHMGLLMLPVADMDLSAYLERADIAKHRELRTFFGCLARALEFLHEQKIRHKDIKPSNILVHGGKVLYTDFGLAHDFTDKDGSTTGSMVNGRTAKYCAPEVADCESRNTSSDIWSLGVVFLEMTAVLKGKTVAYVYEFLKLHGTGQAFVRTNPTGTAALITELKATGSGIDNAALVWVRDMVMLQQRLRPTANLLIGDIVSAGQEGDGNGAFCGICCVSHDDFLSELDELDIADAS